MKRIILIILFAAYCLWPVLLCGQPMAKKKSIGTLGVGGGLSYTNENPTALSEIGDIIAHWKLDEGTTTNRADSSGNSNHLSPESNTGSDTGKLGDAAGPYHVSGSFLRNTTSGFGAYGETNFSVTGWVKVATIIQPSYPGIITKSSLEVDNTDIAWELLWKDDTDQLQLRASTTGTNDGVVCVATNVLAADTWYFFAARRDGTNLSLSVNAATPYTTNFSGAMFASTKDFRIGTRAAGLLNGLVDSVTIFSKALSDTEVGQIYNGGSGLDY